ncbi:MAG: serine/threonine protein kinase [Bdellovibrionales bacterium]|nr:serine/threonine protein kinase [Bdellovibrionales bacterium]
MSHPFEQFGKYILLEKLASGGMAEVFLAKSNGANGVSKFLAIKRILPQYSDNPDFIDMFKEEAKIAVNLNHGNVVSIYDFGIEQNQFYLVMEYVEGRNLRQIINEFKKRSVSFTTEQVVYMVKEVAAGLDHAHRCLEGSTGKPLNITHRDMSPQNIMVSFEGEVKVIDFGIAKAETQMEATKAGTLKGKFGYMSPEQSEGLPIDLRTDVFSLVIVLWELLTSDRLFTANSEAAILRKIKECNIPSIRKVNPSIPPELEKIANKALAKDKTMRYQTAAQMHKDLNRFLNMEYPDFSPHDFSIFVKNNFSDVYAESKRKLVDYAKIRANVEERSSITQTMTLIANEDSEYPHQDSNIVLKAPENPEGFFSKTAKRGPGQNSDDAQNNTNFVVDLQDLRGEGGKATASSPFGQSGFDSYTNPRTGSYSMSGIKGFPRKGTQSRKSYSSSSKSSSWIGVALIAGLVLTSGYLFIRSPGSRPTPSDPTNPIIEPSRSPHLPPTPPPTIKPIPQKPQPPASNLYSVTIKSDPPNARIAIDGRETSETTPARLSLTAGKKFSLRLDKVGYYSHESDFTPSRDGYSINVTLLQGRSGFLNLDVINGGAEPIVEINGQRINDRLPLDQYKVPANVPVRIRVYNPYGKVAAEKTVMVRENERASIHLVLTSQGARQ